MFIYLRSCVIRINALLIFRSRVEFRRSTTRVRNVFQFQYKQHEFQKKMFDKWEFNKIRIKINQIHSSKCHYRKIGFDLNVLMSTGNQIFS